MLYEVITSGTAAGERRPPARPKEPAQGGRPAGRGRLDRITSYNVCYTKLLRLAARVHLARFPDDGARAGALAAEPAVQHRADGKGNRRDVHRRRRSGSLRLRITLAMLLLAAVGNGIFAFSVFIAAERLERAVITSYSIHYTKLYDPAGHHWQYIQYTSYLLNK